MNFTVLSCKKEHQPAHFPMIYKVFPKKTRKIAEEKYKWNRFPYTKELLTVCDKEGQRILLPYTQKELTVFKEEEVKEKLEQVFIKEGLWMVVAEDGLERFLEPERVIDGHEIRKLFLTQWMDFVIKKHRIYQKDMKLLIIDGEEDDMIRLLHTIREDVNYMAVCTNRADYFEVFYRETYELTGLMVETAGKTGATGLSADIVIDFEKEEKKVYRLYPMNSVVIDMASSVRKSNYISVKRPDICSYHQLFLKSGEEICNAPIMQAALLGESAMYLQDDLLQYKKDIEHLIKVHSTK